MTVYLALSPTQSVHPYRLEPSLEGTSLWSLLSELKKKKKSQVYSMKVLESCDLLYSFLHRICVINPHLHQLFQANALAYFTNCVFFPIMVELVSFAFNRYL